MEHLQSQFLLIWHFKVGSYLHRHSPYEETVFNLFFCDNDCFFYFCHILLRYSNDKVECIESVFLLLTNTARINKNLQNINICLRINNRYEFFALLKSLIFFFETNYLKINNLNLLILRVKKRCNQNIRKSSSIIKIWAKS